MPIAFKDIIQSTLKVAEIEAIESIVETCRDTDDCFENPALKSSSAKLQTAYDRTWQSLKASNSANVAQSTSMGDIFRKRLSEHYNQGFQDLDQCYQFTMNFFTGLISGQRPITPDLRFSITLRLHARCCQIFSEIIHLLRGGFADGAFARWRTLHEVTVTIKYLAKSELTETLRFIDHSKIHEFRNSHDMDNQFEFRGTSFLVNGDIGDIKEDFTKVTEKYGHKFKQDWGWVSMNENEKMSFQALEANVNLQAFRFFYRHSSSEVHSPVSSLYRRLGLLGNALKYETLLAGASNVGLHLPAVLAVASLLEASRPLVKIKSIENFMFIQVLESCKNQVDELFHEGELAILRNEYHVTGR